MSKAKMADTSLMAFQKKKREGSLQTDRAKVMYLIREYGPVTSKELQMWMNKPKHTFTGRINELKEKNKILEAGEKNGHTQYKVKE